MTPREDLRDIIKYITYMKVAETLSSMSYDSKHRVASILVRNDFSDINSIGYNGNYKGGPNTRDSIESGQSGFIHAEANMLISASVPKSERSEYTIFVTLDPCNMCAKNIANYGIKNIISLKPYISIYSDETKEIYNNASITHHYINDKICLLYINTSLYAELINIVSDLINSNSEPIDISYELNILLYKQIDYFFEFDKTYKEKIIPFDYSFITDINSIGLIKIYMENFYTTLYKLI